MSKNVEDQIFRLREENSRLKESLNEKNEEIRQMKTMLFRERKATPRELDFSFEISKLKRELENERCKNRLMVTKSVKSKKRPTLSKMRSSSRYNSQDRSKEGNKRCATSMAGSISARDEQRKNPKIVLRNAHGASKTAKLNAVSDKKKDKTEDSSISTILATLREHILKNDLRRHSEEITDQIEGGEMAFKDLESKLCAATEEISKISSQLVEQRQSNLLLVQKLSKILDNDKREDDKTKNLELLRKENEEVKRKYQEIIENSTSASYNIERYKEEFDSLKENYKACENQLFSEMNKKSELLDLLNGYEEEERSRENKEVSLENKETELMLAKEEIYKLQGEVSTLVNLAQQQRNVLLNKSEENDERENRDEKDKRDGCREINKDDDFEEAVLVGGGSNDAAEVTDGDRTLVILSMDFSQMVFFEPEAIEIDKYFMYVDFFESDTQVSPVFSYERGDSFSLRYELEANDFFFNYIDDYFVEISFCALSIGDYKRVATSQIRLAKLLESVAEGSQEYIQSTCILDLGTKESVGRIQICLQFSRDISSEARSYLLKRNKNNSA